MPQQSYSTVVAATGAATITVRQKGTDPWIVEQISPEMASAPGGALGAVRLNGRLVSPFVAQGDSVGGSPPVTLGPTDELTIEWTASTAGLVGYALVIYRLKPDRP